MTTLLGEGVLLDSIFNTLGVGIVIVDVDQLDYPIVFANEAFLLMTGYSNDEVIGRNCRFLQNEDRDQEGLNKIRVFLRNSIASKGPAVCKTILRNYRKDGTAFWNELAISRLEVTNSKRRYFIGVQIDITERIELLEEKARLGAIVENSEDAIHEQDAQGIIRAWNKGAECMYGYSAQEAIGMPLSMLCPPERKLEPLQIIGRIREGEKIVHFQTLRMRKNGEIFHAAITVSPIVSSSNGCVQNYGSIVRDIESEFQMKSQREDFVAALSHDLKNPLLGANRVLGLIIDGVIDSSMMVDVAMQLRESNNSILRIATNLLAVYKHEVAPIRLDLEVLSVAEMVNSAVAEFTWKLGDRKIDLDLSECQDKEALIFADSLAVKRLLVNLIDNAIKFSTKGGKIAIRSVSNTESVCLSIWNSGEGIPDEAQTRLFQRFVQTDSGRKFAEGTGLGLFACKQIMDLHGGTIELHSSASEGTTFTACFPVREVA